MARKYPPRGYRRIDFPLPHNMEFGFSLHAENESKNSVHLPIIRTTDAQNATEGVIANPNHASFLEDPGPVICKNSIVPRISLSFRMMMSKGSIETDALRKIVMNYMPIYTAFVEPLNAIDEESGEDVEALIELQHDVTNRDVYPVVTGTDCTNGQNQPASIVTDTEVFGDYGLTTNLVHEYTSFNKGNWLDALHYGTNAGMLRKVCGRMRTVTLFRDRNFHYYSNRLTMPTVKRGNPYTYCGMLFHLPQASNGDQAFLAGDTTDIGHVDVLGHIRYDEWNDEFDQTET